MPAIFQVNDYYKLLALHKAVMHAKFARVPLDPIISGSPFIAEIAKQIVSTLAEMEVERGDLKAADYWRNLVIDTSGEVWDIALQRVDSSSKWKEFTLEQKRNLAYNLLSPFHVNDAILEQFVEQADRRNEANLK